MPDSHSFGRSFRWPKLLLVPSAIVLLSAILVLYLQTPHAFTHVIVPLVQKYVPGHIEVDQGSITFPAMIELKDLSYHNQEAGLSIRISRLFLRIAATRLLWNRELLVEELNLDQSEVRIEPEPRPPSADAQPAEPTGNVKVLLLPLGVRQMQVNNLTVSIKTESSEFISQNVRLSAREIRPGRSGEADLRGNVSFQRLTDESRWAGEVSLSATIEQSRDRHLIMWNGTNEVALRDWPGKDAAGRTDPITILHSLSGSYDVATATVRHDSSLTVGQGNTHLGKFSLGLTQTKTSSGAATDLTLAIQEVTADALNLGLVGKRPIQLRANHLGGHVNLHAEGAHYIINSALAGKQLQVVTETSETPPLDLDALQAGVVDLDSGRITLERFQLLVADNNQPRLSGELSHPLTILVGDETEQMADALTKTSPHGEGTITIHKFDVPEVRRWLRVFGIDRLEGVSAGQFHGSIAVSGRDKGRAIDVNGNLIISDVAMDTIERSTAQGPMTFAYEFHGTVSELTMLELKSLTIRGAVNNRVRGAIALSGTINLKDPMAHPSLKGSLGLAELPGEMLNPTLAHWTNTRIAHSQLNGTAQVEVTGETVTWKIKLEGRQIALWLPKSRETTIPLDVDLAQNGNFNWTTGLLQLDEATLRVFERSRPVITAILNKPVRLPLPGPAQDQTVPRLDTQPTDFNLEINRLGFRQLSSRLSILDITALDDVKTGYIDAQLKIQWKGLREPASISGSLNITDLRMDPGAMHIREPVRLKSRFDATVSEFSVFQIKKLALQALNKSNILAETHLSGSANATDASMNLTWSLASRDMPAFLNTLGLLDEQQLKLITSGTLEAEGRVTSRGQNLPVSLQSTMRARDLRLQPMPGQFLSYTVQAQGYLEVNGDRTAVDIKPVDLTLQTNGKDAGTLNVEGRWPIATSAFHGSIRLIAKSLDIAPLAELSEAFPGRIHEPLLVSTNVNVALEPRSGTFALRGRESIGPVHISRKDGGPISATLHIEHDLTRDKDTIRLNSLSLTADRPQGIPDEVTANGQVRLTGKQGGYLKGKIASLDAGWYAALFSAPRSSTPPEKQQKAAAQPAAQRNSSNSPAVLLGLDTELTIGSISYGKLIVGPGHLTSQGTGDQRQVTLEPTGFADGKIEATIDLDAREGRNHFNWTGRGDGLNVEQILQTLEPGQEARVKGTGSFTTSGHGPLNTDSLRTNLAGTFDFEIKDGKFVRSEVLHLLAQYTHVEALEHMGFDGLNGKVRMKDGWVRINPVIATGSVAVVDGSISISPTSTVDGRIFAKVGPAFSEGIEIPCMSALLKTPDGLTFLPLAVDIKGPLNDLSYSVDTAVSDYAEGAFGALADTMKSLLQGCPKNTPVNDGKSQSRKGKKD